LETELQQMNDNFAQQSEAKDDMLRSLQGTLVSKVSNFLDQVTMWKNKYEQLAKLYSQLRQEHLELLSKFKSMQLKANSAQEAIDKKERIEREMKSKNLELADMIRERDRARYELDRLKGVIAFISDKTDICRVKKMSWKR
jgi:DNA repair exonuclease SbcCD ATPase subunit